MSVLLPPASPLSLGQCPLSCPRGMFEQEGNYELSWPGTNSMITSTEADYLLRMGGWFMDREGKKMLSFADYQPPESDEVIQLFLFTTIDEEGFGKVHTILEDSGQDLPDGSAVAATPASSSAALCAARAASSRRASSARAASRAAAAVAARRAACCLA